MRLIIAGDRHFTDYEFIASAIDGIREGYGISEIVSGGANGADALGERYAMEHGIPLKLFPARWDVFGKGAGFVRNRQMAEYADMLAAFPLSDSRGTKHMITTARQFDLLVVVYYYREEDREKGGLW